MGATSTHKPAGQKPAEYFADYFTHGEIIASAARRNPSFSPGCGDWQYEFYAAVRYLEPHPHAGEVFALVVLYSVAPGSYYNFTYKDMDETMGPGASSAPRAVLEALTPTDHEYAKRVACALLGEPAARGGEAARAARLADPVLDAAHVQRRVPHV
ncbi:hypothetical protein [Microbacterium panaciterrae]|uniref:hypothetical protein n=1 Tax=Microbacterium panaciterrae TaxID=985759 RepID=UPI0031E7560E